MRQLLAIFRKELKDNLRDRRSLFAALLLPVMVGVMMFIIFGSRTRDGRQGVTFDFAYLLWEDWPLIGLQPTVFFTHLARMSVVLLALWLFIRWYGRRKAYQVEQARRFMEELER